MKRGNEMAGRENLRINGLWERIEDEIIRQDKTKVEIARECGFDRKILYEQSSSPSLLHFIRLCEVLDVNADYLLSGRMK